MLGVKGLLTMTDAEAFEVFHEGLKSWSCCADVNKPVLEFDEFMKIPVRSFFDLQDESQ
jgi:hypothetical protein